MEAIISIVQPEVLLILIIEVSDEMIIAHYFVIDQTSAKAATCTNAEIFWLRFADWERDMRLFLNQITIGKDAIVESRIKMPRYSANETGRRVQEVICQILEIPER